MNCKPGDLAVIVRSQSGNEGKIVQCVRLHASRTRDLDGIAIDDLGPRWVIDPPLTCLNAFGQRVALFTYSDSSLRPIRDQPGADESLSWAGLPNKLTEPA